MGQRKTAPKKRQQARGEGTGANVVYIMRGISGAHQIAKSETEKSLTSRQGQEEKGWRSATASRDKKQQKSKEGEGCTGNQWISAAEAKSDNDTCGTGPY